MKKNKIKSFLVLLLALFCVALPVQALSVETTDEVVAKAYFKADDTVNVNNTVFGSSFIAGNNVTVEGSVDGALFLAGNLVKHSGSATYAAIAGNSIEVSGKYAKDVAIAGNIISVRSETEFGRDVVIMGSEVILSGVVERDIAIYAEKVTLNNAKVNGTAKIIAQTIEVEGETLIKGNLKSNQSIDKKYIEGQLIHVDVDTVDVDLDVSYGTILVGKVIGFVALLITFVAIYLIAPQLFENTSKTEFTAGKWFTSFMYGVIFLVFLPIVSVILMITVVGMPLAFIALALYGIAIYISEIFTGYYVGQYLWEKVFKKDKNELVHTLIGIAAIFLLSLIPYLGTLVSFISLTVGLGLVLTIMKKK